MDGSKIRVGIGERRIDLNGSRVALKRTVDVLHLLQSVAHVAVSVSKRWLDPLMKEKSFRD